MYSSIWYVAQSTKYLADNAVPGVLPPYRVPLSVMQSASYYRLECVIRHDDEIVRWRRTVVGIVVQLVWCHRRRQVSLIVRVAVAALEVLVSVRKFDGQI